MAHEIKDDDAGSKKELDFENGEVKEADDFGKCSECGHTLTVAGTCDNCDDED